MESIHQQLIRGESAGEFLYGPEEKTLSKIENPILIDGSDTGSSTAGSSISTQFEQNPGEITGRFRCNKGKLTLTWKANPVLNDGPDAACSPSPSLPHILSRGKQSKTQNFDAPNQDSFSYNPNDPVPLIESDTLPEEVFRRLLKSTPKHKRAYCSQTPIYAHGGVVVGYWYINVSREGQSPVYCMVEKDFEYAY
jgi:hypothetical protein